MLILRDMIESDIEDYVKWFTVDTEWGNWDAPWEPFEGDAEFYRTMYTQKYLSIQNLTPDAVRSHMEIELDGKHIGSVGFYYSSDYFSNSEKAPIVGIGIYSVEDRKNSSGTKALQLYADYLKDKGYTHIYTQTWSGNYPMIGLAQKLGFKEILRKKDFRTVDGKQYDAVTFRLDLR